MPCQVHSHIPSVGIGTTFRRRLPEIAPETPPAKNQLWKTGKEAVFTT